MENKTKKANSSQKKETTKKKTNPTWEAFGKFKGSLTIVNPKYAI